MRDDPYFCSLPRQRIAIPSPSRSGAMAIVRCLVVVCGLLMGMLDPVFGASQTRSPTATGNCTNDASFGAVSWTNPGRAFSSNNSFATVAVDGTTSNYVKCLGYGFAIPAGATIDGIVVRVERRSSSVANGGSRDAAMRLVKGGVIGATDRATATVYPTADAYEAHGGLADLWGTTWTSADINAANFGAAFAVTKPNAAGGAHTIRADHIEITVYYTDSVPPVVSSITRASADPTQAPSVSWTVVFSESVTGVDIPDFTLMPGGGVSGATITSVLGAGTTWTVTASTGGGGGSLGLNLVDNDSILDLVGNPLGGAGVGNGNFTGEVYTVAAFRSQTRSPAAAGNCTNVTGIGTLAWGNPGRAISSNDSYATRSVDGTTSNYLRCLNYGFTIPAGAVINGVAVRVERRSSSGANGGSRDAAMRLVKGGVIGATDRSTVTVYPTADAYEAHGGAADLWGTTWASADINAANFGAAFAATKPNSAGPAHTIRVDHIEITVYYNPIAPPSSLNACSNSDACPTSTARLFTRIANRAFALYLAALKTDGTVQTGFNGNAAVTLLGRIAAGGPVDATSNCPTSAADLTQNLGTLTFTAGKLTQTGITVADAYRDVRVRIACDATNCPPSGLTVCSSDNFSVRPDNLLISATITSPLKAGDATVGDTFSLSAQASGNAVVASTYNGTLAIDATKLAAVGSGPNILGALDGAFGVASGGTASGTFGYSEAGYFNIAAQGVFDGVFSTAADISGTDCNDDFNNTYTLTDPASLVGCKFGNQAASANIGRFTPNAFVMLSDGVPSPPIPSVTPSCGSGITGLTYAGQSALRLRFSVEAQNKAGIRTQNYDDTYAYGKGRVDLLAENNNNDTNLGPRLDHDDALWPVWAVGRFVVDKTGAFSRNALPDGPYDGLEIGVRVKHSATHATPEADGDDDGIRVAPENMAVAGLNGNKLPGTTVVRFGRTRLQNAMGSELNALPVPVRAEFWNGTGFLTNSLDNCSTVGAISWVASSCTLTPTLSGVGSSLVSGQGILMLAAPNVRGCADMSMAVPVWMRGRWDGVDQGADGNLYDDDPPARATFGVFKDKVLFRRENF